jgi:transglutaminase-like putative cysteine protease
MVSFARRLVVALSIAGVITIAGLSLNRVYNGHLLVELVAGAAAASVLLPLLLRRTPTYVVAPLSLLALAGYALLAVRVSAQAGGVPGGLADLTVDAARNALPRLLTALIPVEPQPDTVLAPVVLAWLAGLAGVELAIRANRAALACISPVLLYAGALVLVGPNAGVQIWQPITIAALVAVALALGRPDETPRRRALPPAASTESGAPAADKEGPDGVTPAERTLLRLRAIAGLAGAIALVLAIVTVVAPVVAHRVGQTPGDPRQLVQPPDLDALDENPLIRISGWAANPHQALFRVAVLKGQKVASPTPTPTDSPQGFYDTRIRLAVLEEWDGVTWHANADYRGAGRVLPALNLPADWVGHPDAPPLQIEERITVDQLDGRLLPAVPLPQRVDGVRVSYDQGSGTLIQDQPLSPGLTYTVDSVSPAIDANLLPAADVPSGPAVAHLLAVGDTVPPDLSHLAEVVTAGAGTPYNRALALQSFLADHYRFAGDAPSGHAYPNLRFFLFGAPLAGGQRGTSEQFASAFATLGRLMGLPTRVVVGFHTPAGGGLITAGDAVAWPEVLFQDVGWVAFDPLPDANSTPEPLEEQYLYQSPPPTTPPSTAALPSSTYSPPPPTSAGPSVAAPPGTDTSLLAGGIGGGLLVLATLVAFAIAFLRVLLRRRRLDRGTPRQRVVGAWDDVLDTLLLAGQPPPPHLAAAGVAVHAAEVAASAPARRHARRPRPPVPPLDELATRVNVVGFGVPDAPTDDLAAHSARMLAVSYRQALRARRPWWRRLLWNVDPRPLRKRRR